MYGKIGANKGLTKETSERIKIAAQKLSIIKKDQFARGVINVSGEKNGMYGKIPWSKGLTKETSEIILNAALKQSKTRKEMWKKLPEEEKNRKRKLWASQGLKCPKKDTSIEKIIKKTLDDLNVKHERNYPLDRWFVDFYLENGKVVECFGDYWHCNPKRYSDLSKISIAQKNNIKRDREKLEFLTKNKISYLVLWEDEINNGIGLKKLKLFI
jgi:very-short-patch-repair endonuclease